MRVFHAWDEVAGPDESLSILLDLAYQHARESGDLAAKVSGDLASRDAARLCGGIDGDPSSFRLNDFYHARQAYAFFQKSEWLRVEGIDPEVEGFKTFLESERLCEETNRTFNALHAGRLQMPGDVERVLYLAQRKIAAVLGPVPRLDQLGLRFGPGGTATITKRDASWRQKFHRRITCSESLAPHAAKVLYQMPHWLDIHTEWETSGEDEDYQVGSCPIDIVHGKLTFVPKKPKVKRPTIQGALLNLVVQLAVGDRLTDRLRRFGVDLTNQGINQALALEGSLTGALATLDLSSASDTIATSLVYHLLPIDWALYLDTLRERSVTYNGQLIWLEKFSSMGNGFTFPLESLIFWALVSSVCRAGATVSVFGDDIICPTDSVPDVIRILTTCGFVVNMEKSYWTGVFRESCGKDYLSGIDVRPYYQKTLVGTESLFTLHNYYHRTGQADKAAYVRDTYLSRDVMIFGPDGYGDGHLIGDYNRVYHGQDRGWSGHTFETYTWLPKRDFKPLAGDHVLPLYSIYRRGPEPQAPMVKRVKQGQDDRIGVTLPGVRGFKKVSIYTLTP